MNKWIRKSLAIENSVTLASDSANPNSNAANPNSNASNRKASNHSYTFIYPNEDGTVQRIKTNYRTNSVMIDLNSKIFIEDSFMYRMRKNNWLANLRVPVRLLNNGLNPNFADPPPLTWSQNLQDYLI